MALDIKSILLMILTAAVLGLVLFVWKLFNAYRASALRQSDKGFSANYVHSMASRPMGGARSPLTWESFSKGQDLMNGKGKSNPEIVRHFFEIPVVLTGEHIPADRFGPEYDNEYSPDSPSSQRDFGYHPPGADPFRPRR